MPAPFWGDESGFYSPTDGSPASGFVSSLYDSIVIAGNEFSNTLVDIDGQKEVRIDAKNAPNTDGANENYLGYKPAIINITWWLYTPAHYNTFLSVLPFIMPKPGKTATAPVDILHPLLELYNLQTFRIRKLHMPKLVKPQAYAVKVEAVEYFPSKAQGTGVPKQVAPALSNIFDGGSQNPAAPPKPSAGGTGPDKPTSNVRK